MTSSPTLRDAGDREAGTLCPHCSHEILLGEPTAGCRVCGDVHHSRCWFLHNGCGSYRCRQDAGVSATDSVLRITDKELSVAVPLPSLTASDRILKAEALAKEVERTRKWNRLAVASLAVAVIGIPAFGIVTGLIAVVIGCIALALHNPNRKGIGCAIGGILLGFADFGVWAVVLFGLFGGQIASVSLDEFEPDPQALQELPDHIGRAMKANVLIQTSSGWKGVLGQGIGSGVILKIENKKALIVTNRHVVDPNFHGAKNAPDADLSKMALLKIKLVGQTVLGGSVVWVAPNGIDLALVTVPVVAADAQQAIWQTASKLKIGDSVFAVGNPHGLGWTHTGGEVSQLRKQEHGATDWRVIQTTAAINPGNSGGGLYDKSGYLIGINTWTRDKRVAEGLNFAVAFHPLLTLAPPQFQLPAEQESQPPPKE